MTEQFTHDVMNDLPTPDHSEANRTLLKGADKAGQLVMAYDAVLEIEPRLATAQIVDIASAELPTTAAAMHRDNPRNNNGNHRVLVHLGTEEVVDEKHAQLIDEAPSFIKQIGALFDTSPERITPKALRVFCLIHEFGHIKDYVAFDDAGMSYAEYVDEQGRVNNDWPLLGYRASTIMKEYRDPTSSLRRNWSELLPLASSRYSEFVQQLVELKTVDDLLEATSHVYRQSKFEKQADQFAINVMSKQPALLPKID